MSLELAVGELEIGCGWVRDLLWLEFQRVDELKGCYLHFYLSTQPWWQLWQRSCFLCRCLVQWMISRDVVIKGWRRDCVTKRNKFFHVTAMVVEPLNAAIQIHQWWEQNPSSLLIMVKSQQLVVVTRWLATNIIGFCLFFSSRSVVSYPTPH